MRCIAVVAVWLLAGCVGQAVTQSCPVGQAWRNASNAADIARAGMVGTFRPVRYTNNHVSAAGFVVNDDNQVRDASGVAHGAGRPDEFGGNGGWYQYYPAGSANDEKQDPNYPSDQGWFFTKCMYGCSHWQYDRVVDGVWESRLFADNYPASNTDPATGSPNYCCTATGSRTSEAPQIPPAQASCQDCPAGSYSNTTDGTGCVGCPAGTFRTFQTGAWTLDAACTPCPEGTFFLDPHQFAGHYRPITYTNGHVSAGGYVISRNGLLRDLSGAAGGGDGEEGTGEDGFFGLVPANSADDDVQDPNFAAADGWLFTRCMFGCNHWSYTRVVGGAFQSVLFADSYAASARSPQGSPNYCCTATGPLVEGSMDRLIEAADRSACVDCAAGFYSEGGGTNCTSIASQQATVAAALSQLQSQMQATVSQLSAQLTASQSDLAVATSRAAAAAAATVLAEQSITAQASRLSGTESRATATEQMASALADSLRDLSSRVTSAAGTSSASLAGTPLRCDGGSCRPAITAAANGDVAIGAPRGKVRFSSDQCGSVDLCDVVRKLDETVDALSNLGT